MRLLISVAPRLLVMKISAREKSTLRLSPKRERAFVENAQQQIPKRVTGFFDLVEQHEAQLAAVGVILVQHFLAQQRMRFAMPQVSGRRADQLGNLMTVLEFRAIDLDDCARIAHQRFGGRFHDAGLAGSRWSQKKEVPDGTARRRHSRQIHLINIDDLLDSFILPDDHAS